MKSVVLLLLAANAPQQFNLECAGTTDLIFVGGTTSTPYQRTLRIDLATNQWCADACAEVEPIFRIEPGRLVLREMKQDTPRGRRIDRESVDRVTSGHDSMTEAAGRSAFRAGQCKVAPFTGFLKGPTKF